MRVALLILVISIFSSVNFAIELIDVSRNYQYRDHLHYLAEKHFVPAFIDSSFQLDAELTRLQVAVSVLFTKGISLNFSQKEPYLVEFQKNTEAYPFIQYIYENELLALETDGYSTCNVSEAISIFSKVYKDITFALDKKNATDPFTRQDFLMLVIKIDAFNKAVSSYRVEKRKREDEYIGSAVSEYILGYASALDRIELSKYSTGNKEYYNIFWLFASKRDNDYQRFYEDLSLEDLDLLDKRLNQALLNFYSYKYWLVIQQCNIILKENPKHLGALKLKGSTYYMLRDFDKARKYWEKALYYQPSNKEIEYFIKVLPQESS